MKLATVTPMLLLAAASLSLDATATSGQAMTPAADFVVEVTTGVERFVTIDAAIAEGYRKLGPDFPGMGEHWVHPSLVISGALNPERPPVLAYVLVGGTRQLVGVAYTRVLGPGETIENGPLPTEAWHDHSGRVDEESLLLAGPVSAHTLGSDFRLSMVHIWTHLENPDGIFAQNNWLLPFHRAGQSPTRAPSSAASRAFSLSGSGKAFYRTLFEQGVGLDPQAVHASMEVIAESRLHVERVRAVGSVRDQELKELERIWSQTWSRLRSVLPPASYDAIATLGPPH